ncbi:alpha/beta hydrolase [Enterococcus sp. AZ103]|uniref:alpha/beta hydrolase n=1 Tax=Enterococcus sp. AZ103 TaxID=2774628 RepID=UPI003F1FE0D2
MKKKFFATLIGIGILGIAVYLIVESNSSTRPNNSERNNTSTSKAPTNENPVSAAEQGSLEVFNYQTNYQNENYDKAAQVYLPAGYDASDDQQYDILYLLHGYSMDATNFLTDEDGEDSGIKQMLDTLIANQEIEPLIVVSPTYYPDRSLVPNGWTADDPLNLRFATEELPSDLVPAIEENYHTFARSTDQKDLVDSRDHRAFGGFSMGAITTWYVFEHQLELFSNFLPMAGDSWTIEPNGGASEPQATAEKLAQSVKDNQYTQSDFNIYATVGDADGTQASMDGLIESMFNQNEIFNSTNLTYGLDQNGGHDLESVRNQLYTTLTKLFPAR